MMIYNTVDYPVIVTIGEHTFRMERDSELELKIPSGDYPFRIHKLDRKGNPILRRYLSGGRYSRGTTIICLAASALLTVRRDTKIYFREKTEPLISISSEYFKQEVYDILIENGEINHRSDGYLDESIRKKMIRKFQFELIGSTISHLLLIVSCFAVLYLLPEVLSAYEMTENDLWEILPFVLAPILGVYLVIRDISQSRKIHIFRDIPVISETIDYDYL